MSTTGDDQDSAPHRPPSPEVDPLPPVIPPARKASLLPQWLLDSKAQLDSVRQNAATVDTKLKALNVSIGAFTTLVETSKAASALSAVSSSLKAMKDLMDVQQRSLPQVVLHDVLGPDAAGVVLSFLDVKDWMRVAAASKSYNDFVNWGRVDVWSVYYERHCLDGWSGTIKKEERCRTLEAGAAQFYTAKKSDEKAGGRSGGGGGGGVDDDGGGDGGGGGGGAGYEEEEEEEEGSEEDSTPGSTSSLPVSSTPPLPPLPLPPSQLQFLSRSLHLRSCSLSHAHAVATIRRSFGRLITQRTMERKGDFEPHVYSKHDREVAFPLAMPVRRSSAAKGALRPWPTPSSSEGPPASSSSSTTAKSGALMSHVNTLGSDARKDVLVSLTLLCDVSANPCDVVSNEDMIEGGIITVLSALLANESGAIKELAALNLANFLVTPVKKGGGGGGRGVEITTRYDRIGESGFIARARDEHARATADRILMPWSFGESATRVSALRSELIRAKALPGLVGLLSSPHAKVTLHNARHNDLSTDRIASMRCQSLANKHASRGLVNLLLPDLEICMGSGGGGGGSGVALPPDAVAAVAPTPTPMQQQQQQGQTVMVIRRSGVEFIPARDLDDGADGAGGLRRAAARDPKELDYLGSDWMSLSGGGKRTVEWTAFYFYSSGTLKDQFTLKMQLGHLVKGSGVDNIGPFIVDGESDTAFGSTSFAFSFTYTNRGGRPRGGHVSHIGHWSGGNGALGPKSCGLWGTWEPVSSQRHFELQKGGVFRLIPTEMLERMFDVGEEGIETVIQPWDVRGGCV